MKKNKWMVLLASTLVLSLAACGPKEEPEKPVKVEEEEHQQHENIDTPETETDTTIDQNETEPVVSTSTGTFVGTSGVDTIEINVGGKSEMYQLTDDVKSVIGSLNANANLTFDYYKDEEGKNVLMSLTVNESKPDSEKTNEQNASVTEEWVFVGMIDGHSAEFKKGSSSIVAQYNEKQSDFINQLNENDVVKVQYKKNSNGQDVIETITK